VHYIIILLLQNKNNEEYVLVYSVEILEVALIEYFGH